LVFTRKKGRGWGGRDIDLNVAFEKGNGVLHRRLDRHHRSRVPPVKAPGPTTPRL
jgi:hypothetical protein